MSKRVKIIFVTVDNVSVRADLVCISGVDIVFVRVGIMFVRIALRTPAKAHEKTCPEQRTTSLVSLLEIEWARFLLSIFKLPIEWLFDFCIYRPFCLLGGSIV